MSSILDALNRSDAERRRGQPPTLGSPSPFAAPPRRRPAWLLPAIAGLALVAAWWGGAFDFGGAPADDPAASVPDSVAAPETGAPSPSAPVGADAGQVPDPVPAPVPQPPEVAATSPEPAPAAPADGGQVVTIFGPQRATPAPAEATPATTDAGGAAAAPAPTAAEAEAAAAQALAQALERPAPPAAPASSGDAPPRLHELPFAVRRGLPALAVTMHLYSDDPARRFALVNGVRVRDGESLPGGVEVLAIRADGILVRFEGTEFVLPVRG